MGKLKFRFAELNLHLPISKVPFNNQRKHSSFPFYVAVAKNTFRMSLEHDLVDSRQESNLFSC